MNVLYVWLRMGVQMAKLIENMLAFCPFLTSFSVVSCCRLVVFVKIKDVLYLSVTYCIMYVSEVQKYLNTHLFFLPLVKMVSGNCIF